MHVPSYYPDAPRRRLRAAAAFALLAGFALAAHAVDFDEKVKAPSVKDPAAFSAQASSFVARAQALRDSSPESLVLDHAVFRERFDLEWQLQQAMNQDRPLGDLSALGLKPREEGGYDIDYNESPQWDAIENSLSGLLQNVNWELYGTELRQRGFRDEDVATLESYVQSHDLDRSVRTALLPVTLSFAKIVKKYDKLKRPVDEAVVLSYLYQRSLLASEVRRAWMADLLNALDPARRRILMSRFLEMRASGILVPDDQPAEIADVLATVRRPDLVDVATAESKGETP